VNNEANPMAIEVDGADVYFISSYGLKKVPIAGGAVVDIASAENASFSAIAADATHVYWTNYTLPGSTMRIAKAGGVPDTINTGDDWPSGLLLRNGRAYWTVLGSDEIKEAPVAGGSVAVFASAQPGPRWGLAADNTYLYWLTEGEWPNSLYKAPLAGGPPVLVASSPLPDSSMITTLVVDATHAYFAVPACAIAKVPLAGGPTETISFNDQTVGCPQVLTADAANLYYTSQRGITKFPK
jgi:hypothetical protein